MIFAGTPSPTRTDMNRSSTDFESVALGLKPFITLTFVVCINVLYQCFFSKSFIGIYSKYPNAF